MYKIIQVRPNTYIGAYITGQKNFSPYRRLGLAYNITKRHFILKDGDGVNKTIQTI